MNKENFKIQLNSKNAGATFALFTACFIIFSLLGQIIVGAIFGNQSSAYKAICGTFSTLAILAVILVYTVYGKNSFTNVTSTRNSGGWFLPLGLLLAVGMFLGLGFVNDGLARAFTAWGLKVNGISLNMPTVWHFLAYTVSFAILPSIFEEFLFRGILLNCLSGVKRVTAVLLSALCFALYHQSFAQLVYQFIYGVALGFLATVAKSVFPCIIAHFLNNFAVILFTFLNISVDLYSPILIVIGINALAIFGAVIFFAMKKNQERQTVKGEIKNFFLPFGAFGILVCLAVAVGNLVG